MQTGSGLADQQPRFRDLRLDLPATTRAALADLARQHQLTLNTLVQGAWALLLGCYSGEDDVLFGATASGRPPELPGVETMIGLFINTLPVRTTLPAHARLLDWLGDLQRQQVAMREHEHTPLVQVQGWSQVPRGTPLFDTLIVFENFAIDDDLEKAETDLHIEHVHSLERTNYPLTLTVDRGLAIGLTHDEGRFDTETATRMLAHLERLFEEMIADPERPLAAISPLTAPERQQLLHDWNDTARDYPTDVCVHALVAAQAARTPEAVAVVWHDERLTYAALDARANQLAHYLQARGVGPEVPVGIYMERSLDLIVAVLAVLKAGGAYAPLDTALPAARVHTMLAGLDAPVLLTHTALADTVPCDALVLRLDRLAAELAALPAEPPPNRATADSLAYVVHTSGSTGTPKGVMVTHRSWANAYFAWEEDYALRTHARGHLQMASFAFDVFAGDLARALCSGGKLVLCPREWLLEPDALYALMQREAVDCAEFVPAVLRGLVQHLEDSDQDLAFMRVLIAGSDSWHMSEYARFRRLCGPATRLVNSYGISETTIDSTFFESGAGDIDAGHAAQGIVPIGRPFGNTRLYILDAHMRPVPTGIPGELYIGGAGVARGYWGRPDMTAERFVLDPFRATDDGARLYRTGDRACYLPDGNVAFLGRVDTQVKLRGYRVELGEIESVLARHPAVHQAVVLLRQDGDGPPRLVGYPVPAAGAPALDPDDLRAFLRAHLPDYMVPSFLVVLDALPLTPNGKLDRRGLPAPGADQRLGAAAAVPPRNPTEATLVDLWQDVLAVDGLGVLDDFFDTGGHSLLATQIISRVNAAFGVALPLRAVFEHPTVAAMAERVTAAQLEQAGDDDLAGLLDELDDLSDEEARALLGDGEA